MFVIADVSADDQVAKCPCVKLPESDRECVTLQPGEKQGFCLTVPCPAAYECIVGETDEDSDMEMCEEITVLTMVVRVGNPKIGKCKREQFEYPKLVPKIDH